MLFRFPIKKTNTPAKSITYESLSTSPIINDTIFWVSSAVS
jgi:hypothetical protein